MGSITFDFLTESFLFDPALIEDSFAGIGDTDLAAELNRYREFCLMNTSRFLEDAVARKSVLRVFAGLKSPDTKVLKQSAFYVDQYVLPDPLFPFTEHSTQMNDVMRSFFNLPKKELDRENLARVLRYTKDLTPMVAADYVKFIPFSYIFEPPEELPIYASDKEFADVLPREVLNFFRENTITRSLRKVDGGWVIEEDLSIGRAISMQFRNHDADTTHVQHLFEQEVVKFDEETHVVTFRQWLPDTPPSQVMFEHWVRQSENRAAIDFYDRVRKEIGMGSSLGASYFSTSHFVHELLTRFFPTQTGTAEHTGNTLLSATIPFLDDVDTETLMRVRQNDAEGFLNFRAELDKRFWDLRFERDPEQLRAKAEEALYDLSTGQTQQLAIKAKELRRGVLAHVTIASATFVATMLAGLNPAVPAVIAAASAVKAFTDYRANIRPNPVFFLWKVIGTPGSRC